MRSLFNERRPHSSSWLLPLLLAAVVLTAAAALCLGGAGLSPREVLTALGQAFSGHGASDATAQIVWDIRLPRIILAIAVGASLGLAGVAAQTLFRNPLASPYVLGVSNGAALGAVAAMLLVGRRWGVVGVPAASLCGGLLVGIAVFVLARRSDRFGHSLLLAGIALGAFCSALTAAALYLAGERLQTLVFWLMGGLWQAGWRDVLLIVPVCAVTLVALMALAPAMNVALVGERSATDLGDNVRRLQTLLLLIVSVATDRTSVG